jgi:hypothetical protein
VKFWRRNMHDRCSNVVGRQPNQGNPATSGQNHQIYKTQIVRSTETPVSDASYVRTAYIT